jgi:MATE family multidrug resistance protein
MNKEILKLAIPNIISNISVPLLSSVDTALMGRLSEIHIGAVGIGAMIFNFVYWNFGFLRMGTTGMAAQAYGSQNDANMVQTLGRALMVAVTISLLLVLIQWPLSELSIRLMNVDTEQSILVEEYFYVRIWAAPAALGLFVFMGWFFGMQNAIYPLILTILINTVNIVLSIILVDQYQMGVAGVAYGTLIAQYVGLFAAAGLFIYRYRYLFDHLKVKALMKWEKLRYFLKVNGDIFIRTFFLTASFGFFYSQSSAEGAMILAVNTILFQFLNWMSYAVDGFAYASESLVGKYKGAKSDSQTRKAIRYSFYWGMGLAALFSLAYALGGIPLLHLFTNQPDVIAASIPYLSWMIIFPMLSTPCYIWDGIYVGLTAAKSMRNSMLLAFGVFVAAYFAFRGWGNHGLWLALLIFMVARAAFQQWLYWRKGLALE